MVGILNSVRNNELENKALTTFKKIDCEVSPRDIEAYHCLKKDNGRGIVKFSHCKDCKQIKSLKKDLNI